MLELMSGGYGARTFARSAGATAALLIVLPAATVAADVELGRYLSAECVTCHGGAKVTGTIPNIYGLAERAFVDVVKAYRDKKLANVVMQNIAGRLTDEEIEALAAYFARTRKP